MISGTDQAMPIKFAVKIVRLKFYKKKSQFDDLTLHHDLERTTKSNRQSDQHWNCFKGNIGETPERGGGAQMGLP